MASLQKPSFEELRDWLTVAGSEKDVRQALARFAGQNGFSWFTYVALQPSSIRGLSNYPMDWQRNYLDENLSLVDPVITHARQARTPFIWSNRDRSLASSRKQTRLMRDAATLGIRSGITIPVAGGYGTRAAITFASSEEAIQEGLTADPLGLLSIGAFLHAYLPHRGDQMLFNAADCPLTVVQLETLSWLVQGKTSVEIAQIRGVSTRAIEYQLNAVRQKLGANTTIQSVAIALDQRWIAL